jgi:hypothetical protein
MKSLIILTTNVLRDVGALCGVDTTRDGITISRRSEAEGVSFLEITLPTFAEALEGALARGRWVPDSCKAFGHAGALPRFLRGFANLIFAEDGTVRGDASTDAVYAIRQICRLHKKVFAVCDDRYTRKSFRAFVECENDLEQQWLQPQVLHELGIAAARLFGDKLSRIDAAVYNGSLVPQHGPGATADRISGNQKYDRLYWTERLNSVAPIQEFLTAQWNDEEVSQVGLTPPGAEIPVRVIAVPKTANKARVIAMEPCTVQFAQQALLREFKREFSGSSPFVDLTDQEANQRMALAGSIDGRLATIDLSEASDRVSVALVEAVFGRYPSLLEYLLASRSTRASVPGFGVIPLSKFASMGSALCFPVESIVFATIAAYSVASSRYRTLRPSTSEYFSLTDEVRVFGDDIVVPTHEAPTCLRLLVALGAKPNGSKSFLDGPFRESCGRDYMHGVDVTVVYRRRALPRTRRDVAELVSTVSLRNQLYQAGLWGAARYLDGLLRKIIPLPTVGDTSPVLGRVSVLGTELHRWDRNLQSPLVWGAKVSARAPLSRISGGGALLKCTLPGRFEPFEDKDHLTRAGRPRALYIKLGWGSSN